MVGNWVSPFEARMKKQRRIIVKEGLNKSDIAKYHKFLKRGASLPAIARKLHTKVSVLEKLTPEKVAEAKLKAKAIEKGYQDQKVANQQAAEVLSQTAARVMAGGPASPLTDATPKPALGKAPETAGTPKSEGTPTGAAKPAIPVK